MTPRPQPDSIAPRRICSPRDILPSVVQQLSAGDQIQARYNANGLFMNVSLENTTFSVIYLGAP